MKRLALIVIVLAVPLACIGVFRRHALACDLLPVLGHARLQDGLQGDLRRSTPPLADMPVADVHLDEALLDDVFLADDLDRTQAAALHAHIAAAHARISATYGAPVSRPRMLVTGSARIAQRWGGNDTATLHRSPWRSCIVVGPQGQGVDVIAHEWLHAEMQHRVGFWRTLRALPTWFDEGAALTVDHRAPFLPAGIALDDEAVVAVQQRTRGRSFFTGDAHAHYRAARLAVIPRIVPARFYADLARLGAGEPFEVVFAPSAAMEAGPDASP